MAIATIVEDLNPIVPTTIVITKINAVRIFPPNSPTIIEDQPVLSCVIINSTPAGKLGRNSSKT